MTCKHIYMYRDGFIATRKKLCNILKVNCDCETYIYENAYTSIFSIKLIFLFYCFLNEYSLKIKVLSNI